MKKIILFAMSIAAWAQGGLDRPQLGKMLDENGAVRTVFGISSSVTLGDAETAEVISSACSATLCLAKTETSVLSGASSVDAPPGPALFAFDGASAFIWFSRTKQLAQWKDGALMMVDASVDGIVLSICANQGVLQFAVRRLNGIWIVNQDGSVAGALPRLATTAMLIPGGVVYAERGEVVIGNARFPLEHVTAFSQMSASYLQVRAGGVDYALRIDPGRETLFQLPGVAQ